MGATIPEGTIWQRMFSSHGFTSISNYFVMDWLSLWTDVLVGLLIASIIAVIVPSSIWQIFFFKANPLLSAITGPLIGPLIATLSFVCSIGNVPLAAILWSQGMSFGGVVAFIFADLIILPILNIYRKYYGIKMAIFLFFTFYVTMSATGLVVELVFKALGLTPRLQNTFAIPHSITMNYTTYLNIIAIVVTVVLLTRFLKNGGTKMPEHMKHSCCG
jgi:uncharacterized membrane protein YraQ (UPF0718 family)